MWWCEADKESVHDEDVGPGVRRHVDLHRERLRHAPGGLVRRQQLPDRDAPGRFHRSLAERGGDALPQLPANQLAERDDPALSRYTRAARLAITTEPRPIKG